MSDKAAATDADAALIAAALRLENFFPEFTGEHCAKCFPRSAVWHYEPEDRLIEQGASGRDLFVVLEGTVSVSRQEGSRDAEVVVLGPNSLLGEVALLRDGTRTATVSALTSVRAFRLVYEDMGYVLAHNAELASHLDRLAARRAPRGGGA